jgi:hypothetical protein
VKRLLPTMFMVAGLGFGCATKQQEAAFQPVPAASNVDPSLGHLATLTGTKVYEEKEAAKKTSPKKQTPKQAPPSKSEKQPKSDKLIVTPETGLTGKVVVYNNPGRFVVLNYPIGQMPKIGSRLFVYRNSLKTGEVKITGPQRDDNIVADLLTGEAQSGDEVRDK